MVKQFSKKNLIKLINIGYIQKKNIFTAFCFPQLTIRLEAKKYLNLKKNNYKFSINNPTKNDIEIVVDEYTGNNPYVIKMKDVLRESLQETLRGVFVHGSLGTYEEINYSDFDALAVIKQETISDSEKLYSTIKSLNSALKIMYEMDPLQHHGWFILTEDEFFDYPDSYFPAELFRHSKSLSGRKVSRPYFSTQ